MKKLISIILTITLSFSMILCISSFAEETSPSTKTSSSAEASSSPETRTSINQIYGSTPRKGPSALKKFLIGAFAVVSVSALAACAVFKDTILNFIKGSETINNILNFDFLHQAICTPPIDKVSIQTEDCQKMINGKTIPLELANDLRYTCSDSENQVNHFENILKSYKPEISDLMSTTDTDPDVIKTKKSRVFDFFKYCVLKYSECKMEEASNGWYKIPNKNLKAFKEAFENVFGI